MAVYTQVSSAEIDKLLSLYGLGTLSHFSGIESGVENTNYFVDIQNPEGKSLRLVLTLFEYLPEQTLPFFIDLTEELAATGLPAPAPYRDRQGSGLHRIQGKPCLLQTCLPGKAQPQPGEVHCQEVGAMLARIHLSGQQSSLYQQNQRGIPWLQQQQQRMVPLLPEEKGRILKDEWQRIEAQLLPLQDKLPAGVIHGDLFHDNVLFEQDQITGVIDFYNACHDWLLYDVAVAINDWGKIPGKAALDKDKCEAFLTAYNRIRPFTSIERQAWPIMLQLAATRFWISRLYTFTYPEEGDICASAEQALRNPKDPDEFLQLLLYLTEQSDQLQLPR